MIAKWQHSAESPCRPCEIPKCCWGESRPSVVLEVLSSILQTLCGHSGRRKMMVCWVKLILHLRYPCDFFLVREVKGFSTLNGRICGEMVEFCGEKTEKTPPFYLWQKRGRKKIGNHESRMGQEPILILPNPSSLMCHHTPAEKWSPRLEGCEKGWWDIPQGQVVLETRLVLCHRLFPAEIRKTCGRVSWLLAVRFAV